MFFRKKRKTPDEDENITAEIAKAVSNYLNIDLNDFVKVSKVKSQFTLSLPVSCALEYSEIAAHLVQQKLLDDVTDITISQNIPIYRSKQAIQRNVKNIIAVSSGKGGVGKSATAVNIALALQKQGARVGILDADIYGPSVPIMLGTQSQSPESDDNKTMHPISAHGLVSNSIGYLVKNDHASIWRGPMVSKALSQLLRETLWPLLDYLIVDMPPGTGDIQLTMAQQLPLTAALIVTTPQDIAVADAAKGIAMYEKLDIPILGLIENMGTFVCPHCGKHSDIFDKGGADDLAQRYDYPVLAKLPLNTDIRQCADAGKSIFTELPDSPICSIYAQAAKALSINIHQRLEISEEAKNAANGIAVTQLD